MATDHAGNLYGENPDWTPCGPGCEGWHVFDSDTRGLEIEACDESRRFLDSDGANRDDWAAIRAGWRGFGALLAEVATPPAPRTPAQSGPCRHCGGSVFHLDPDCEGVEEEAQRSEWSREMSAADATTLCDQLRGQGYVDVPPVYIEVVLEHPEGMGLSVEPIDGSRVRVTRWARSSEGR